MATPKIIADFETQLATALAVGGTSFTLSSATDDDGVALPTGKYYFTIDNGTSQKEYVVGTLTGTSVASVSNVTRQGTESSGVDRAHRVGASVIMTDFLTYKNYIDETTVAGAADADTNTKGVVEGATLAEVRARTAVGGTGAALVITPDVAVDMPTEDEKAAMAGSGTAPSASNKFLTVGDVDDNTLFPPQQIVTFTSSGTWTKDAGLRYVVVEVVGGGGGGGGGEDTTASVDYGGTGGGAGAYSRKLILASALSSTEIITVGVGGTAGANSGGSGGSGGTSSFGSHSTSTGGAGGTGSGSEPGAGGSASGGDINITGGSGRFPSGIGDDAGTGGYGGDTILGLGGRYNTNSSGGTSATGYGGGGGGGNANSSNGSSGYAGGPGIVIVTEYY